MFDTANAHFYQLWNPIYRLKKKACKTTELFNWCFALYNYSLSVKNKLFLSFALNEQFLWKIQCFFSAQFGETCYIHEYILTQWSHCILWKPIFVLIFSQIISQMQMLLYEYLKAILFNIQISKHYAMR